MIFILPLAYEHKFFNYSKGDYVKANRLARLKNWNILISNNVNESWDRIKTVLLGTRNECIPFIKRIVISVNGQHVK